MAYTDYIVHAMSELTGGGTLRERLMKACLINLVNMDVKELPSTIRKEFRQFRREITRVNRGEDALSVEATIASMNESEVQAMIDKIISMYDLAMRQDKSHINYA